MRKLAALILIASVSPSISFGEVTLKTVASGLHRPSCVAIQPETNAIYVAECGTGRVVRLIDGRTETLVDGLPSPSAGGAERPVGPLGLAFLAPDLLIVTTGAVQEHEQVRVYVVPGVEKVKAAAKTETTGDAKTETKAVQALLKASFSLPMKEGLTVESDAFATLVADKAIFLTGSQADGKGSLVRFPRNGRNISPTTGVVSEEALYRPVALTMSPAGELVLAQMGDLKQGGDSLLTFYSKNGLLLTSFKTGLNDISGLAYSPSGNLYATDCSVADPSAGGLFQITAERQGRSQIVRAKRIATMRHPSSLAFADDGSLLITVYEDGAADSGKVVRIDPGL